jgi:hypothetical protein
MIAVAVASVAITSCSQQPSPAAPSSLGVAAQPTAEYWVTLFDETPGAPVPPPDAPAPPDPSTPPAAPAPLPPGSAFTPWPPGPPPAAQPGVPVPTPPSTHTRLHIRINPEPVMHSGVPVATTGCGNHPYTWYYDQHLISDTGVVVTFGERENFFDGRFSSKNSDRIEIPGNREVVLHTRWCSGYPGPHYTQTRFKGSDEYGERIEFSGPWVRLLTP